jgi:large subunit ribosomal protein L23
MSAAPYSPHDVIRVPVITEKASEAKDKLNKITFLIDARAGKIAVKKAVEAAFGVKVEKVNIVNQKGKTKRLGRFAGKRPDRKKAVVTLKEGHSIEVFDQV